MLPSSFLHSWQCWLKVWKSLAPSIDYLADDVSMITAKGYFVYFFEEVPFPFSRRGKKHTVAEEFRNHPGLYTFCTQTLLQHKTKLLHSMSRTLLSPVSQVSQCSSGRQYKSPVSKYFVNNPEKVSALIVFLSPLFIDISL